MFCIDAMQQQSFNILSSISLHYCIFAAPFPFPLKANYFPFFEVFSGIFSLYPTHIAKFSFKLTFKYIDDSKISEGFSHFWKNFE